MVIERAQSSKSLPIKDISPGEICQHYSNGNYYLRIHPVDDKWAINLTTNRLDVSNEHCQFTVVQAKLVVT